jgi:hypothetical protein
MNEGQHVVFHGWTSMVQQVTNGDLAKWGKKIHAICHNFPFAKVKMTYDRLWRLWRAI